MRTILSKFLELPGVLNAMLNYIQEEMLHEETLTSMFNGNLWRQISKQCTHDILLPLFVYFDDYESSNPLGTHAGVHKIGAVYFSLGCIPPKFCSRLENIFFLGHILFF